jgi:hypothetical protein
MDLLGGGGEASDERPNIETDLGGVKPASRGSPLLHACDSLVKRPDMLSRLKIVGFFRTRVGDV